jgi:hypothetical protein
MRRDDICLYFGPADRAQLGVLCASRNTPRKVVWRAETVLATADGCGTFEIMRRAETSKPTVWRWQERYLDEGVAGLRRDKTRPSRVPPLPREVRLKVIARTVREAPANATHWSRSTSSAQLVTRRCRTGHGGPRPQGSDAQELCNRRNLASWTIHGIRATLPDGSGAQSIGIALQSGSQRKVAMLLLKQEHGVKDAYTIPCRTVRDQKSIIERVTFRSRAGPHDLSP